MHTPEFILKFCGLFWVEFTFKIRWFARDGVSHSKHYTQSEVISKKAITKKRLLTNAFLDLKAYGSFYNKNRNLRGNLCSNKHLRI
jgi:hypothetical protein